MSCVHIQGTRRIGNDAPLSFTGKKDRTFEVEQNAKHSNPLVRATAASSPHASATILADLARDPEVDVRKWVARNTSVTTPTLWYLAEDVQPVVRAFVAWNPNTPVLLLNQLSQDSDEVVRQIANMVLDNRA